MTDQLFAKFPMLDAAIVNAVIEQFAAASGQIDIGQASRALELMLPPGYQTHKPSPHELPDSICVMDPMQTTPYGHSDRSAPGATNFQKPNCPVPFNMVLNLSCS